MRGHFLRIFLLTAGCLSAAGRFASGQSSSTPTVTPTGPPAPTSSPAPSPTPSPGPPALPSARENVNRQRATDAAFMTRVQKRGLEAVELARIAAERVSNTSVRALGQQILQDRGKANEELRLFARNEGITLPTALDAAGQSEVNRASRLSSPALERAVVLALVRISDADIADFQKQTEMSQEVELEGWVYDMFPVVEELGDEIHRIAAELGISSRAGS